MKIISWNVNGIRAIVGKDLLRQIEQMQADVLCFQETKALPEQVKEALKNLEGYYIFANSAERKGYSGTAILAKSKPVRYFENIGVEIHDSEGRVQTADFGNFYLVNAYVPNSGNELARLSYRQQWDKDLAQFLGKLKQEKPVIFCGDLNVAHRPIDIARPEANYNKSAGYTQAEIDGMDHYLAQGFTDSFRFLHPNSVKYSWWSFRANAREKNIGWRIDYVLLANELINNLKEAFVLNEFKGSDHCPVGVELVF